MNRMSIADEMRVLIGAELTDIGRAANMVWLIFVIDEQTEYSLHLQCPFRFVRNERILVAAGDLYIPATSYIGEYSDFDYDVQGNNLFDERSVLLKCGCHVMNCIIGSHNDLIINMTEDVSLNCFMDSSASEEQWRFFRFMKFKSNEERDEYYDSHPDSSHLVVTPLDYEIT